MKPTSEETFVRRAPWGFLLVTAALVGVGIWNLDSDPRYAITLLAFSLVSAYLTLLTSAVRHRLLTSQHISDAAARPKPSLTRLTPRSFFRLGAFSVVVAALTCMGVGIATLAIGDRPVLAAFCFVASSFLVALTVAGPRVSSGIVRHSSRGKR
jgi:hypothetical protein